MNQILSTGPNQKKPTDIKKIIKFFCIAIILFGIILLGQGSYTLYKNYNQSKIEETIPQIQVSREDKIIKINISHDKVIDKMLYHWNQEQDSEVLGNNRISFTQELELPVGTNTLTIKVIDINGKESTYTEEYTVENELNIELSVIGNKISIKAQDPDGMNYLTYKWNNNEEIRVEANGQNKNIIEIEEEIPVGLNTLIINAVNVNNIVKTKEQDIKGVKKPEVSVTTDGVDIIVSVIDEEGIKEIEHKVNEDEPQKLEGNGQKKIEYKQSLISGDNYVTITVTSNSGAKTEFKGVCYNE